MAELGGFLTSKLKPAVTRETPWKHRRTPRQSLNILSYGILQNQRVSVTETLVVPFVWRGKSNSQVCDYNCDVVLEINSISKLSNSRPQEGKRNDRDDGTEQSTL
ncbi:hypothetical protein Bbelb_318870 [Branchiostoma belcheri]|nr:hypothetical protein Bbelb_318870 [Branchiostoma belcheri]